ncbi:hypothetical protein PHYBLDRAFT_163703 [Phycomyces blakesleeanus NRRL 1555(-)]|uniref:Uncharacterized protein n=1 Tax=Phycomyces blakesleeanus (strain ATCC 8743b / DSM 1359 / FGSC 10004 / NBRC 33097 / NRRL 1555) TaxID=763407 RepID=A0A162UXB9_PHYB8|nr:hypothetical protein PHYBLDRAFT_163703 [Phycomyces blakesleeanus NRRL 1555(-)]OAD78602.1 hypothetical protein PHYBLDRAFT_163703 [Phycomyces blakesleeanus NRRL 1555(-)]|eukprot:XP_018296642.1 hypothetical protein PHYBLDRAFT_163703 [Phycomyces blakesleeanus NRRL 1555(-)]
MWRRDHYLHHGTITNNQRSSPLPSDRLLNPHQNNRNTTTSWQGYSNQSQSNTPVMTNNLLLRKKPFSPLSGCSSISEIYGGNEFDIFGSEQSQVDSINHDVSRCQDRLIICLEKKTPTQEQVRYQLLKRKRSVSSDPPVRSGGVFLEPTASINSPVNFFKPNPKQKDNLEHQFMYL